MTINLEIPEKFEFLFRPMRYKCCWGGRGGAKSISIARALISQAYSSRVLILCTRMYQNSIQESVHRTIASEIYALGMEEWFEIQKNTIICRITGSQFIFKGLQAQIGEIKSMHGINIMWVEEAQSVTEESWLILDPTIRQVDSEIYISFNPDRDDDPTYRRFVLDPPENCISVKVGWQDNPWFPEVLNIQRRRMLKEDPGNYDWVWEGLTRHNTEASVYRNKYVIQEFDDPPEKTRFYHGLDFGYSVDPTVLVRCWTKPAEDGTPDGEDLMIDREAYAHNLEIDEMKDFFVRHVDTCLNWPVKADESRPETISYLMRQGVSVTGAEKWKGSVEDGIAHVRGFRKIRIHETRCPNTAREFRLYQYRTDKRTNEVLPILEDKNDHAPDAVRYALDGLIQKRGGIGVWRRL
jgi:phage terminase large subunit